MKNSDILLVAILIALFAGGGYVVYKARGLRNNNPGNIKEGKGDTTQWVGERATNDDAVFEEFITMEDGVRAAAVLFRNYQKLYGLNTIAQLIGRWAPPSENDTAAYINAIVQRTGVSASTTVNLSNIPFMVRFLRGVFRQENGIAAETIPETTMISGIQRAA